MKFQFTQSLPVQVNQPNLKFGSVVLNIKQQPQLYNFQNCQFDRPQQKIQFGKPVNNNHFDCQMFQNSLQLISLNLSDCYLQDITNMNENEIQKVQQRREKLSFTTDKQQSYIDISPLKFLVNLEKLQLNRCQLNRLDVLSFLVNLKELELAQNYFTDLAPLQNLVQLKILNLGQCNLTKIGPLKSLVNLEELNLSKDIYVNGKKVQLPVINMSPLKNLVKLKILNLDNLGKIDTIELQYLTELEKLNLDFCYTEKQQKTHIIDITSLQLLTKLSVLHLCYCEIQNIVEFKNLVNLKELHLFSIQNADITPLQFLTKLEKLFIIMCDFYSLEPLIPLKNLKELSLSSNSILYVKPLKQLKHLEKLDIQNNKIIDFTSYFTKFLSQDQLLHLESRVYQHPTEYQIQFANILRDIYSPVTLLRNISDKRKQLMNIIVIQKTVVNIRIQEQLTKMVQQFGQVVQLFQQLSNEENCL
ncbi:Leucine_Rich Repeat domain protein [Hexamita inflata]|uniref:Leucine Rich Repeat domain protein n=1 Tax=Hexamita inflata TaxID=28002 RepID=A0AA86QJF9_9EUKA|nr:Leucine Rich Repeat domain protein [Hexamita inflata]